MNGLHLIGDLTGCRCDPQLLLDGERFRAKCLEMVASSGLTTMDATFHTFDGGGFTGTVVLAESHLAIHTWPERQGLTLDVYVSTTAPTTPPRRASYSTCWWRTSSRANARATRSTAASTC